LFSRDSSYGGSQITESIMSEIHVGFEEAEALKLGGPKADEHKGALEEIFKSVVSEWVREIKRALDFVASTYPDETIEQIIVSGGSCRIPGFQEYLKRETGIPVAELNPFADLIIDDRLFDLKYLSYMAPQAAVAVGLALRSIGDK
ncbi:MAG: pilus assembly protein PilM, partial [Deltaproteobacteria bacterium]|nr:pilus assembly protein PilM [Deltaproteobacteria bacterium]